MRNNKKDIVIQSLVERKLNKSDSKSHKYDYYEELSIAEKRLQILNEKRKEQLSKELKGQWVIIVFNASKFEIFVPENQNIEDAKKCFLAKLEKRSKK